MLEVSNDAFQITSSSLDSFRFFSSLHHSYHHVTFRNTFWEYRRRDETQIILYFVTQKQKQHRRVATVEVISLCRLHERYIVTSHYQKLHTRTFLMSRRLSNSWTFKTKCVISFETSVINIRALETPNLTTRIPKYKLSKAETPQKYTRCNTSLVSELGVVCKSVCSYMRFSEANNAPTLQSNANTMYRRLSGQWGGEGGVVHG